MKRQIGYLSLALASLGVLGWSQSGGGTAMISRYVALQGTTPGDAQTGHSNISGTMIAGAVDTQAFTMAPGAAAGYVLTSDALGIGSWQPQTGFTLPFAGIGSMASPDALFKVTNNDTGSAILGETSSTAGYGIMGSSTATSGYSVAGYFECASPNGRGVLGKGAAGIGRSFGVWGQSESTDGIGVYGRANGAGVAYGIWGSKDPGIYGWAIFSLGDFGATGVKQFRIDHPFDPENKYLLHYSTESPMPQNFYLGNVITDSRGYAWVELPDYFQEINANFKYQLTVVDDTDHDGFVMAKVSKKIRGNRFQVRTSAPNVEVSWRVDADRNDLYVRHTKPKDVIEKQGRERGTYQHPEFYGEPMERGINYMPMENATRPPR